MAMRAAADETGAVNSDFEVTSQPSDIGTHAVRLVARGELDVYVGPVIVEHVTELADRGVKLIILDLAGVTFLDSSGLRGIIKAGNVMSDHDGQLLIEGAAGATQRVLEITGMLEQYRAKSTDDDPAC
jgi:anti-anti-sigma factor